MDRKTLKKILEKNIEMGLYQEVGKLPTEDQLIETYGATRYTIRKTIDELAKQSVVYRVQGSGVYIRENKKKDFLTLSNIKGISSEFADRNVTTQVISISEEIANSQDLVNFKCNPNTIFYRVVRVRYVDDIPFAIEKSSFIKTLVPYINKEIAEASIFDYLQTTMKTPIGFADKIILSRKLTKDEADLLKLEENDPALIIQDTVYNKNGEVFDCSEMIYNYQKAKFFDLAIFK